MVISCQEKKETNSSHKLPCSLGSSLQIWSNLENCSQRASKGFALYYGIGKVAIPIENGLYSPAEYIEQLFTTN